MTEPKYGDFDGIASRYNANEAWVLYDKWVEINNRSHSNAVRELTKAEFDQLYQDVPPLPSIAFRSEFVKRRDQELFAELTPKERRLVRAVMDDYPALTVIKTIALLKAAGM